MELAKALDPASAIKKALPDALLNVATFRDETTLVIDAGQIVAAVQYMRDTAGLYYNYLSDISAVDYYPEVTRPGRFGVSYHLYSMLYNRRIRLKIYVAEDDPTVESVIAVWPAADWLEREGVSDDEAIQRTAFDLRWKVALGLDVDEKLCAKSTLQLFRSKLVLHDKFGHLFQASIDACLKAGLLKRKKLEVAIDTTPVLGRGAVKDTFNLISDQIRTVVIETVALKGVDRDELIAEHGLSRHFGKSFKGEVSIDWNDAEQKRALVGQLVADARVALELAKASLRGYAKGAETTRELRKARDLLAQLLLQDIEEEPEDKKGPKIRKGTKK